MRPKPLLAGLELNGVAYLPPLTANICFSPVAPSDFPQRQLLPSLLLAATSSYRIPHRPRSYHSLRVSNHHVTSLSFSSRPLTKFKEKFLLVARRRTPTIPCFSQTPPELEDEEPIPMALNRMSSDQSSHSRYSSPRSVPSLFHFLNNNPHRFQFG